MCKLFRTESSKLGLVRSCRCGCSGTEGLHIMLQPIFEFGPLKHVFTYHMQLTLWHRALALANMQVLDCATFQLFSTQAA